MKGISNGFSPSSLPTAYSDAIAYLTSDGIFSGHRAAAPKKIEKVKKEGMGERREVLLDHHHPTNKK